MTPGSSAASAAASAAVAAPSRRGPVDPFGRVIDYLRISVTDRCNLRCVYCMPLSKPDHADGADVLTAAEIEDVVRAAASVGFRKFRLTGGEPTVRPDIEDIVRRVAAVPGVEDLAMTTNALRMPDLARPLRAAGLRRVNVHLDSLSARALPELMRLGKLESLWRGIVACEEAGLAPIKLNVVVVRGGNDADVAAMARLAVERSWHVRFIELMPLGASEEARVSVARYVPSSETKARVEAELGPLVPAANAGPSDEAENFSVPGGRGVVGFISPVSRPYCGGCNRMRLTSDGRFHLCLLRDDDMDVRGALRGPGAPAERAERVARILVRAVSHKPTGHQLDEGRHTKGRRMHQIGG